MSRHVCAIAGVIALALSSPSALAAEASGTSLQAKSHSQPASADAQPRRSSTGFGTMDNQFSAFGLASYYYDFTGWGLGARYQKILVPEGWLHTTRIHDEFGLEGGIDYIHYRWDAFDHRYTYNEYAFLVGAVWNLWLKPNFAVYPKVDLGVAFGSWSNLDGVHHPSTGGVVWDVSAGLVYKFDSGVGLRAEAGSGYARIGASYAFF